jgi:DNA-binding CsgD family transcriptional regulator
MKAQPESNKKSMHDLEREVVDLKARITFKDMELTRISTAVAEKTGKLKKLLEQIESLDLDQATKKSMKEYCLTLIDSHTIGKMINSELTEADSVFLSKLQKKHPKLNQREMRVLHLVKLNHDTRDIAQTIGISTRGLESIRYRLHKKLNLGKHQSIKTYLCEFAISE